MLKETTIFSNNFFFFFFVTRPNGWFNIRSTARIEKQKNNKLAEVGEEKNTGGHDTEAPSWIQVLQQQQVRRKAFHLDCSLFKVRGERDKPSAGL